MARAIVGEAIKLAIEKASLLRATGFPFRWEKRPGPIRYVQRYKNTSTVHGVVLRVFVGEASRAGRCYEIAMISSS